MLIGLENVIRRIYTYRTVYPFSLKCNNIRRSEEYDNDTNDAYSIEVQQINDDGSSPIYTEIFYLPRIVRGSVKVKGRAKQGIYTALGNFKIRIGRQFFSWGNGYSGTQVIDVNWEKVDRVKLKDVYKEGLGQQIIVEFSFSNLIKYFNLWTDDLVVYFDPETLKKSEAKKSQEFAEEIPKFLNECVIPYESLLKLRLLSKDPSLQEKVGINEVKAFIELMKKGNELADMPTPLDYKFLDTYEALAEELGRGWDSRRNYYYKGTPGSNIRYETSHNFQKNGKLYLTPLQREINNFFSNKEGAMFSNVQEVTDTNALSVAEQNSKIYFEEWSNSKNGSTYEKQRLNPAYFVGVIDAIFTADSKDINIKNELTRDAVIRDGQMFIKLYNKKFEEVEVSMYDYLMSATLSPDNIDYENKKIFPVDGKYSIYKFGEYTFTTDVGEITYLRKRDGIMTDSVAMIPFVNKTQIMRSMLSAHMLTQAIPVEGSSRPFVYTGHGKEIFNQTALNQETPVDGKVTVITDEFMRIDKSDGGDPVIIKKPDTYNTANHTSNFFTPCVSVGDKVKAGQTVYSCSSFKGKELALGVPLLTAFTSFYAREHEDGMVLSESATKKFGAEMMCKVQIPLMKQDEWFLGHNVFDELPEVDSSKFDDLGLIKLGSQVRRGDTLFACWARLDPRRSEIARLQLALDKNAIPKAIYMAKVPHKVPDGTVTRIYFNPVRGYQSNGSMTRQDFMKLATHFGAENRSFRSREAQQLGIDIRQLKDYMIKPTNFSNEEQIGEIVIEITYINPLKVSDKMANMYGLTICSRSKII